MTPNRTTETFRGFDGPMTPWDHAQTGTTYAPGVVFYTTGGHGGFQLSEERIKAMPHPLAHLGTFAGRGWYEEDCDWVLVAVSFHELFDDYEIYCAVHQLLGGNRPVYMDGVDVWLESPAAQPLRERVNAIAVANADRFQLAGLSYVGGVCTCRAVTLKRDRVLTFEMRDCPPSGRFFTRADVEAMGAAVKMDRRKEDAAA